jgi:hypothetical protein
MKKRGWKEGEKKKAAIRTPSLLPLSAAHLILTFPSCFTEYLPDLFPL